MNGPSDPWVFLWLRFACGMLVHTSSYLAGENGFGQSEGQILRDRSTIWLVLVSIEGHHVFVSLFGGFPAARAGFPASTHLRPARVVSSCPIEGNMLGPLLGKGVLKVGLLWPRGEKATFTDSSGHIWPMGIL